MSGIEITPFFEWVGFGPLMTVMLGGVVGGLAGWGLSRLTLALVLPPAARVEDRRITCAQSGFTAGALVGWLFGGVPGALFGGLAGIILGWP